jgi:hypothetical protein
MGAEQLAGLLFVVVWAVLLWTRRDLKGLSIKLGKEQTKRRHLIATLIEATEDPGSAETDEHRRKRKLFTDLLRED